MPLLSVSASLASSSAWIIPYGTLRDLEKIVELDHHLDRFPGQVLLHDPTVCEADGAVPMGLARQSRWGYPYDVRWGPPRTDW